MSIKFKDKTLEEMLAYLMNEQIKKGNLNPERVTDKFKDKIKNKKRGN